MIDVLCDFGVSLRAKNGTSPRVRIEQRNFFSGHCEMEVRIAQFFDGTREEDVVRLRTNRPDRASGCEETERFTTVSCGKQFTDFKKAEEAYERLFFNEVLEKELRCICRCNSARQDAPTSASRIQSTAHTFSEHSVDVDVTSAAEREGASVAN